MWNYFLKIDEVLWFPKPIKIQEKCYKNSGAMQNHRIQSSFKATILSNLSVCFPVAALFLSQKSSHPLQSFVVIYIMLLIESEHNAKNKIKNFSFRSSSKSLHFWYLFYFQSRIQCYLCFSFLITIHWAISQIHKWWEILFISSVDANIIIRIINIIIEFEVLFEDFILRKMGRRWILFLGKRGLVGWV